MPIVVDGDPSYTSILTEDKEGVDKKALIPILVTESGRIIETRAVLLKAWSPILVTESDMVIDVKLEQPSKADSPILVTESGIVIDVKLEQPLKLLAAIVVTEGEITALAGQVAHDSQSIDG